MNKVSKFIADTNTNIKLTPKQYQILILLYRYRFLNRRHIQKFLNHKGPRWINSWLKQMTDENIITRIYSKKIKENTKPAIYHLSTKSRQILLNNNQVNPKLLRRAYTEKNRSTKFINHCLNVADIYFDLKRQSLDFKTKLYFYTKTDLTDYKYLPYRHPDAYIALETKNMVKRYFLEIIDKKTPRFVLRNKIMMYLEYAEDNVWQKNTGHPFPSILILCPDIKIKQFLHKHINQVLEEECHQTKYYLGLVSDIKKKGIQSDTWIKA